MFTPQRNSQWMYTLALVFMVVGLILVAYARFSGFILIEYKATRQDNTPILLVRFNAAKRFTVSLTGPEGEMLDSKTVNPPTSQVLLKMGKPLTTPARKGYKLIVTDAKGRKVLEEELRFKGASLKVKSCRVNWGEGYGLIEVVNEGDLPIYLGEVSVNIKTSDGEVTTSLPRELLGPGGTCKVKFNVPVF